VSRYEKILDEAGENLSHVNANVKKISRETANFNHVSCAKGVKVDTLGFQKGLLKAGYRGDNGRQSAPERHRPVAFPGKKTRMIGLVLRGL
jgi:hypothetical protein